MPSIRLNSGKPMEEDRELIQRFKDGDKSSFEKLVKKYEAKVFNTIYSLIGDSMEADDIAQEVFMKVYQRLEGFNFESKFTTWLYRITVNTSLDHMRKRKTKVVSLDSEDGKRIKELLYLSIDPSEALERRELQEMIQMLLNSISPKYRTVLVLKEIEGLSYKEISKAIGCSIGTVESRLFRARAELRRRLEPYYEELR